MFSRKLKRKFLVAALGFILAGTSYRTTIQEILASNLERVVDMTTENAENAWNVIDVGQNETASVEDVSSGEIKTWNGSEPIPDYAGQTYVELNGNKPYFTDGDLTTEAFEIYSDLDSLGRCGQAYANICKELMPTDERGEIGMIKPSGWHTVKYSDVIKDRYLYNRCHLIAFCLAGENANEKNLITGTRYLNVDGMLPFETEVAKYVEGTNNHVLYRVTPIFVSDELTCRGVEMEALSVEDNGAGICFHIFAYNEQPGITIDHRTGDSREG